MRLYIMRGEELSEKLIFLSSLDSFSPFSPLYFLSYLENFYPNQIKWLKGRSIYTEKTMPYPTKSNCKGFQNRFIRLFSGEVNVTPI